MAHQVTIRLVTSPCIKPGQGNPVGGIRSPKQAKQLETAPDSTVWSSTGDQAIQPITYIQRGKLDS